MTRFRLAAALVLLCSLRASAQGSLAGFDSLNVQVHGFATQGFLYTTRNNWATTSSSDGSAAWTEAVLNLTAQPESRLRIGVQARYYLLGDYGNKITLDWAEADYKFSERLGVRVGKVKTPTGLFNEVQDVDPAYLWILLPQSIYPLPSRNSNLAHFGGVLYGVLPLGELAGKLEYHAFGGERVIPGDDGYFQPLRDNGLVIPNATDGPVIGGSLRWHLPVRGLLLGAADAYGHESGAITVGPVQGTLDDLQHRVTYFFVSYDHKRLALASEFNRIQLAPKIRLPGPPLPNRNFDTQAFYAMTSYRVTGKLSAGLYYSSSFDKKIQTSSARYQKDWALAARYDFNTFLYGKFEQHFIDGTLINYSALNNAALQPNTRMTLLKIGVTF